MTLDSISFIIYTALVTGVINIVYGTILIRILKKSESNSSEHKKFAITIKKTKLLVANLIVSIILVLAQFIIFRRLGDKTPPVFIAHTLVGAIIEMASVLVIMIVLGDLSLLPYFTLFNTIHNDLTKSDSSKSNPMSSMQSIEKNNSDNLEKSGVSVKLSKDPESDNLNGSLPV
ncbi:hypothetical protein DLAC_05893 [Tieghemostelium lacteum]|uniref:Uncharacterized protein n=1 Tax=Tieghemostelium lacteum TaxID=361077 RepID=A0A151ZGZ5_TIELA|nr:hypothetical protein DLAC_05893 [Tieghemostelium lacteum]|eukprot:KYQ93243.1 hypothetical protein DLAC_05893 [Tieghemostelium lacteum]